MLFTEKNTIYPFSTCSLNIYCLLDTVLSIGKTTVNKADPNFHLHGKKEKKKGRNKKINVLFKEKKQFIFSQILD